MEVEKIIEEIVKIVKKQAGPHVRILLYGSHAKGNALDTSDVDVAIDAGNRLPFEIMLKIKEDIDAIPTLRSIDIVDYNDIGTALKNSIIKNSKEICAK